MHSTTMSSGTMKRAEATPTMKPSMMASVRGRRICVSVPWPGCEFSVMTPRSASMLRLTTSMPTPRPDRLVSCSAVEKPGSKMSW